MRKSKYYIGISCTDFQKLKNKTILKIFKKSTIIPNAINNKKIILK